jgi:hypothetical protein
VLASRHVIHRIVYRYRTRHVIQRITYRVGHRCSQSHPPHSVPVLARGPRWKPGASSYTLTRLSLSLSLSLVCRCSQRHPLHSTSSIVQCTSARHVIQRIVYRVGHRCSWPRHPPHSTSSTAKCTGARHVIHRILYRYSPRQRHPPYTTGSADTAGSFATDVVRVRVDVVRVNSGFCTLHFSA